jgi:hypothetical protein
MQNDLALLMKEARDVRGDERSRRIVDLLEARILKRLNPSNRKVFTSDL